MSFSESVKEILDDVDITILIIFLFLQFSLFSAHAFVYKSNIVGCLTVSLSQATLFDISHSDINTSTQGRHVIVINVYNYFQFRERQTD